MRWMDKSLEVQVKAMSFVIVIYQNNEMDGQESGSGE